MEKEQLQSGTIARALVKEREDSRWFVEVDGRRVAMNASEAPDALGEGDEIDVFLYLDRRGDMAASAFLPHITVGSYGWGRVLKCSAREGAAVDIGSAREVIVNPEDLPKIQSLWPQNGDELFMTLRTDPRGQLFGRLATEDKVAQLHQPAGGSLTNRDLRARSYRLLPVGTFALTVPDLHRVFIHHTEQEEEPRLGEEFGFRVIGVKGDGTLNGSRLPRKQERLPQDAERIREALERLGQLPLTDKSSPADIERALGMSKAAFKRALGRLMKEGIAEQRDGATVRKAPIE